jgi:hypothetical protein
LDKGSDDSNDVDDEDDEDDEEDEDEEDDCNFCFFVANVNSFQAELAAVLEAALATSPALTALTESDAGLNAELNAEDTPCVVEGHDDDVGVTIDVVADVDVDAVERGDEAIDIDKAECCKGTSDCSIKSCICSMHATLRSLHCVLPYKQAKAVCRNNDLGCINLSVSSMESTLNLRTIKTRSKRWWDNDTR